MNQINSEPSLSRVKIFFLGGITVMLFTLMFTTSVSAHNNAMAEIEAVEMEIDSYLKGEIVENRLKLFCDEMKSKGVGINESEILLKCSRVKDRNLVSNLTGITEERILYHAQLADLVRVGISEVDAQLLLLSHTNLIDEFTGENLSVGLISKSDVYKMKMEVDEYASTHGIQTIPFPVIMDYRDNCNLVPGLMEYGSLDANFIRK